MELSSAPSHHVSFPANIHNFDIFTAFCHFEKHTFCYFRICEQNICWYTQILRLGIWLNSKKQSMIQLLWQNVCFLIICKLQFLFPLFSTTGNFVCMCAELKAFELSYQIFYLWALTKARVHLISLSPNINSKFYHNWQERSKWPLTLLVKTRKDQFDTFLIRYADVLNDRNKKLFL